MNTAAENFLVTPAAAEDAEQIFSLWSCMIAQHTTYHPVFSLKPDSAETVKAEIRKLIDGDESEILKAVTTHGEIAGISFLKIINKPAAFQFSRCGYIAETVVAEKFRSSGCGALIVKQAEQWFREKKVDCVELQVSVLNERGQKFWKNAGFEPTTFHMTKLLNDE